ncbi:hypothetical protein AZ66_13845 [Paenibacillus sp. E194]|nr:hypothetical protein AZ66_13845 [Paenibacillus sp. E194]
MNNIAMKIRNNAQQNSLDSNNRVEAVLLSGPYGKVAAAGHRIQIRDTGNGVQITSPLPYTVNML